LDDAPPGVCLVVDGGCIGTGVLQAVS
jgi:hypothetical protein